MIFQGSLLSILNLLFIKVLAIYELSEKFSSLLQRMPIKTALLCLAGYLISLGIVSAASIEGIEDANFTWRLGGALQTSDNIFLDSTNEVSDTIWVFSPGIELNIGQEPSNANVNFVYVHDFVNYTSNGDLDRDDPDAKLSGYYRTSKSRIDYGLSYVESSQNDASNNLVGDLARRDLFSYFVRGEWDVSAKSSVSAAYDGLDVSYDNPGLSDRDVSSIPLNYYWEVSPKLDLSVGYRYRNTSFGRQVSPNPNIPFGRLPDYDDQFLNVGVRGELGPKTTGEIRIGVQDRDFNTRGVSDDDLFSADARVLWEATENSNMSVLVSRDFNADAFGTSIESTELQLSGSTTLRGQLSGFASIRLTDDKYGTGRSDDGTFGQLGFTFTPNMHSSVSLSYMIYNNSSDLQAADFDNAIINFSGTLRY